VTYRVVSPLPNLCVKTDLGIKIICQRPGSNQNRFSVLRHQLYNLRIFDIRNSPTRTTRCLLLRRKTKFNCGMYYFLLILRRPLKGDNVIQTRVVWRFVVGIGWSFGHSKPITWGPKQRTVSKIMPLEWVKFTCRSGWGLWRRGSHHRRSKREYNQRARE